jgi:hypothetical protein
VSEFATRPIFASDPASNFSCGKLPLDEFFQNHALANDRRGIGKTFVLPRPERETEEGLPQVLGYYTLSMADIAALLNAGSDPIGGEAGIYLPPADLKFQEQMRLIYVTGDADEVNMRDDEVSRSSMKDWCVFNIEVKVVRRLGHEVLDPTHWTSRWICWTGHPRSMPASWHGAITASSGSWPRSWSLLKPRLHVGIATAHS